MRETIYTVAGNGRGFFAVELDRIPSGMREVPHARTLRREKATERARELSLRNPRGLTEVGNRRTA